MHQPEVTRLAALVLALVVAAPVARGGYAALVSGTFLVEFLTQGRVAALSRLTTGPDRRPFALPGGAADLYDHRGLEPGRPLVLVHGLTPQGKDDPRVGDAAALLARAGFDVVVPTIPGLTHGRLGHEDVDPVIGALQARDSRTVLVGVSVGAGPALLAAADPRVRDRVSAVLSLGGYASAREVVRFWLTGDYAFRDARGHVAHEPALVRAFVRASADRLDPGSLAVIQTGDQAAIRRLLEAPPPDLERYLDSLSPVRVAPALQARLFLVHGRADRAVPYTESLRLAAARPDRSTLVLVGLVEHVEGGRGRGFQELRDFLALWRVMYALCAGV